MNYSDPYGLCKKYRDGSEDPDCRRLVTALHALADETDRRIKRGRNPYRQAAEAYEATSREVMFVHPNDQNLNPEDQNFDGDPTTFAMGRTMQSMPFGRGQILINERLGEGDMLMTAAHEILVHGGEGWFMWGDSFSSTTTTNNNLWLVLPQRLRPSAELWRRKLGSAGCIRERQSP